MRPFSSTSIATLLVLLATGCGGPELEPQANNQATPIAIERSADAAETGLNDVIGATPGPCGSTRAESALGKRFSPELAAEIKRVSGASRVNSVDFHDESPKQGKQDPRRINVLLSEEDRVILLDCG